MHRILVGLRSVRGLENEQGQQLREYDRDKNILTTQRSGRRLDDGVG